MEIRKTHKQEKTGKRETYRMIRKEEKDVQNEKK